MWVNMLKWLADLRILFANFGFAFEITIKLSETHLNCKSREIRCILSFAVNLLSDPLGNNLN
jgi:hypothetical protein